MLEHALQATANAENIVEHVIDNARIVLAACTYV